MESREFTGQDGFRDFEDYFHSLGIDRVFLVTGKDSYSESGASAAIDRLLDGKHVTRFNEFTANPDVLEVSAGAELLRRHPADVVLAIGGGSVLDMGKCVSLLSQHSQAPAAIVSGKAPIENPAIPVVAIPTTAGSGSEATRFATVYIDKTKHSLEHDSIRPVVTVVDPAFTLSLSPYQTAVTGIDALSQAIESYWSIRSSEQSRGLAARAIELAMTSLEKAVSRPDRVSRLNMIIAANLAGKAINITKTTACHALSYYLTSRFLVPHGHAVALTLSRMLEYNSGVTADDVVDERGVSFVRDNTLSLAKLLGAGDIPGGVNTIETLMTNLGLRNPIPGLDIDDNHIRKMVHDAMNSNRMSNNPRSFTAESLASLLNSAVRL